MKLWNDERFEIERMDARDWPLAEKGYVFLADALERVGRTKFGNVWDTEVPEPASESEEDFQEWERVTDNLEKLEQQRVEEVAAIIAGWARAGDLVTAVRDKQGGSTKVLAHHRWNFENWRIRFRSYDISLVDPFSSDFGSHYLYVRLSTLVRCIVRFRREIGVDTNVGPLVWEVVECCLEMFDGAPPPAMQRGTLSKKIEETLKTRGLKLASNNSPVSDRTIDRALQLLRGLSDGNWRHLAEIGA